MCGSFVNIFRYCQILQKGGLLIDTRIISNSQHLYLLSGLLAHGENMFKSTGPKVTMGYKTTYNIRTYLSYTSNLYAELQSENTTNLMTDCVILSK